MKEVKKIIKLRRRDVPKGVGNIGPMSGIGKYSDFEMSVPKKRKRFGEIRGSYSSLLVFFFIHSFK